MNFYKNSDKCNNLSFEGEIIPPRLKAKNLTELHENACKNFKKTYKILALYNDNPTSILIINDISIYLHIGNKKLLLESIKKANQKLKNGFVKVNKEALKKDTKKDILKNRNDLFKKWIIIKWFMAGGLEKHIFLARAKLLWLELFTGVYESISKKKNTKAEKDKTFLEFTNEKFAKFVDEYKWYESEKKDFDIGLMKALEELPEYHEYSSFVEKFKTGTL